MPYCTRDVLARKFRQNWLNKFSDIHYSSFIDKEIDDSLTNLNWLPNMNLNKLTSQTLPISPIMTSSLNSCKYIDLNQTFAQDSGINNEISCTWDQIDDKTRIFYKTNTSGKPPFSHISLICMAIQDIGQSRITSTQICEWIIINFPYYQLIDSSWQNSVRNLLSVSKCFQKVPRRKDEPEKGGYWRLSVDYQKYLNQSTSVSSTHVSSSNAGKSVYSQSSLYNNCSNNQHMSSFCQMSNSDSGHNSNMVNISKKSHNKSLNFTGQTNYNYPARGHTNQNQYWNQLKKQKMKYQNSIVQYNIHSSFSQFQHHLTSNFLPDCNNDNRFCLSKNFYMNPAAISTPIAKGGSTYPSHFSHYPYFSMNGARNRNRNVLDHDRFFKTNRHGPHRFGSNFRPNSSQIAKPKIDSNNEGRTKSSLQQSSNSAFSSFRNLVHKRSYQFSVQSPNCRQFSKLASGQLDYLDCKKNGLSTSKHSLNKSARFIDQFDNVPVSFSFKTSSDQFLINPDSVKNELSFNSSPELESSEFSESKLLIQVKEELKSVSNEWWDQSNFDACSMDVINSCEKSEPLVSSPFMGLEKDQQWVDEELNLEELDSILGLS